MTKEITRPEKTIEFNPERCTELYKEALEVFKKYKPTIGEILIAYGNLGYALGASIGNYKKKGPSIEELEKLYYSEPHRLDVALMLQGMLVTTWFDERTKKILE
jgi:hypothetical protein